MSSRNKVFAFAFWGVLTVGALVLSILAAANDTLPGDRGITSWLQDQPLPGQDLSDFVRAVTSTEVVLATGAAVALILWLRGRRRQAIVLAAGLAVLALAQFAVKEIVDRPRPDAEFVDIRAERSSPSFPSGHVMSGTYLFGFLIYLALTLPLARGAAVALVIAPALIMAMSGPVNVWLGAHWTSDVLGGYLFAGVILLPLAVLDFWRLVGR